MMGACEVLLADELLTDSQRELVQSSIDSGHYLLQLVSQVCRNYYPIADRRFFSHCAPGSRYSQDRSR